MTMQFLVVGMSWLSIFVLSWLIVLEKLHATNVVYAFYIFCWVIIIGSLPQRDTNYVRK